VVSFLSYVDSGADTSLFPKGDALLPKVSFYDGEYRPIVGVGRVMMPAYVHDVKMRIGETVLDVSIAFADSDEVPRLLGRADVFGCFGIVFDEANLQTVFELCE
jgi:hypothetical protein